jgi:hypothetical protein
MHDCSPREEGQHLKRARKSLWWHIKIRSCEPIIMLKKFIPLASLYVDNLNVLTP